VVVGAAADQLKAALLQAARQRLAVAQHLLLVELELGGGRLLQCAGQAGDGVVVGAALQAQPGGGRGQGGRRGEK
jgi:hypothetical protein